MVVSARVIEAKKLIQVKSGGVCSYYTLDDVQQLVSALTIALKLAMSNEENNTPTQEELYDWAFPRDEEPVEENDSDAEDEEDEEDVIERG